MEAIHGESHKVEDPDSVTYVSAKLWSLERPHILIICCSDGRYQEAIDEFLNAHLGINDYDRVFIPGGPAALATSALELGRTHQFRKEVTFLIQAHGVEETILIFHGRAEDGPGNAVCADYRRVMPRATPSEIARRQEEDYAEAKREVFASMHGVRVRCFRAEVGADERVQFVPM